ncbi:hypothetical protein OQA88_4045 [Cercophora sp. LCS_1]
MNGNNSCNSNRATVPPTGNGVSPGGELPPFTFPLPANPQATSPTTSGVVAGTSSQITDEETEFDRCRISAQRPAARTANGTDPSVGTTANNTRFPRFPRPVGTDDPFRGDVSVSALHLLPVRAFGSTSLRLGAPGGGFDTSRPGTPVSSSLPCARALDTSVSSASLRSGRLSQLGLSPFTPSGLRRPPIAFRRHRRTESPPLFWDRTPPRTPTGDRTPLLPLQGSGMGNLFSASRVAGMEPGGAAEGIEMEELAAVRERVGRAGPAGRRGLLEGDAAVV